MDNINEEEKNTYQEEYIDKNDNNQLQDASKKIINNGVVSGKIYDIDEKNIYISGDEKEGKYYLDKENFKYKNGRTAKDIDVSDIKVGDFLILVEFNSHTEYYSKGHNINSVNDLEIAKGNINSIVLDRNTINKKSPAVVTRIESTDS